MDKIKELYQKYKEIIVYLVFGVLTTLISMVIKFGLLAIWKLIFNIPYDDTDSQIYLTGAYLAQGISWVIAVLFAFFTNRKWVFTQADKNAPVLPQLAKFVGGRAATGAVEFFATPLITMLVGMALPKTTTVVILMWNLAEFIATAFVAVVVIIGNYIFSKLLVFRNKK